MARRKKSARANGMGTLELKPNGVYLARWTVKGHKYSQSTGKTIKSEAEKVLAELVKPFQNESAIATIEDLQSKVRVFQMGLDEEDKKKSALRIGDALGAYLRELGVRGRKISDGTEHVYTCMFNRFEKFIKKSKKRKVTELREVTEAHVKAFLLEVDGDSRSATYNRYLKFFRDVWNVLGKEAKLTDNPWVEFGKQKLDTISRRNLTLDELKSVLASLDGEWKRLVAIGLFSGMRLVDCCHLEWDDLDFTMHRMSVVTQKTKRKNPQPILIPLHPDLESLLSVVPKEERVGYVVPMCARLYDTNGINHRLKSIFENCGINTNKECDKGRKVCLVGFHSLRSGFVTMAAEAGIPFPIIQAIVGHASTRMTEHYFRTPTESLHQCVNAIPSLLSEDSQPRSSVLLDNDVLELLKSKLKPNESMSDGLRRILTTGERMWMSKTEDEIGYREVS